MNKLRTPHSALRILMRVVCVWFVMLAPSMCVHGENKPLLDKLPQGALQSAFQILRRDYIRRDELTYEELNRAALLGLLERLRFGAELVPAESKHAPAPPAVHAEILAPDIAYLRPDTFTEGEAALFEKELAKFVEQKARYLILDLRGTRAAGSIDEAALVLQCFVPSGSLMFSMKQIGRDEAEPFISKHEPLWKSPIIVLTDADTNNAAETVAACLRQRRLALLMGTRTRGAAVRYATVKLDDKITLRYASGEVVLHDGATVFQKGLDPDFSINAKLDEKWSVFQGGKSMKPFIHDRVRPRFNEAALVTAQNPELDAYVRRSQGQPLPGDEGQVRDVVTQHALDLIRSAEFASQAKINWKSDPAGSTTSEPIVPKAIPANP